MEKITSRQNKTVREAAALLSSAEERAARGEFLCEGARLCQDAARSGIEVLRCFVTAQALEKYAAYLRPVLERARQSYLVADHVAGLLSSTKSPQGVFCQCRWPQGLLAGDAAGGGSCAVLEDLQDPGNLGTILRTADAFAMDWVLCCGTADLFSPKVVRASMGAVFRQRAAVMERQAALAAVRRAGLPLYAAALHRDSRRVGQIDLSRCAVAIGNEAAGVSAPVLDACEGSIYIPMPGRAESLNAAVAAGIVMWEMIRGDGACR